MEAPLISDLEEKTEMIFSSKEEFPDLTDERPSAKEKLPLPFEMVPAKSGPPLPE